MKDYVSDKIITLPTLRNVLNKINRQYQNDRIEWIQQIYDSSEMTIIEQIKEKFIDRIKDERWYDIDISDIEVEDVRLYDASIVQDNEDIGETTFQLDADICFSAEVVYEDYSMIHYDKELMPVKRERE